MDMMSEIESPGGSVFSDSCSTATYGGGGGGGWGGSSWDGSDHEGGGPASSDHGERLGTGGAGGVVTGGIIGGGGASLPTLRRVERHEDHGWQRHWRQGGRRRPRARGAGGEEAERRFPRGRSSPALRAIHVSLH